MGQLVLAKAFLFNCNLPGWVGELRVYRKKEEKRGTETDREWRRDRE